jgi:hypothetical protein
MWPQHLKSSNSRWWFQLWLFLKWESFYCLVEVTDNLESATSYCAYRLLMCCYHPFIRVTSTIRFDLVWSSRGRYFRKGIFLLVIKGAVVLHFMFILPIPWHSDRLCGLVVKVPGNRSRGLGFDSRRYQMFWEVVGSTQPREYNWAATWKK